VVGRGAKQGIGACGTTYETRGFGILSISLYL
jgi:hypothetical protein